MHIMAQDGWKRLTPRGVTPAPKDDGLYRGPLPSSACLAFIKHLQDRIVAEREGRLQAS